jgi:glutathione S-transferase
MPRLFYMPRTRSNRVLWALYEIGAPFESTRIAREERRSPEHLARQPLGRVPAFELDDGTMMFESTAILLQLGDLHPESGLLPPLGSAERALVYQWLFFGMTELEANLYRWMTEVHDAGGEVPDSRAAKRFAQAADAFADALGERQWLLDDRFTLADIVNVGVLGSAESRGLLADWPTLRDYVARGESRPAHRSATTHGD